MKDGRFDWMENAECRDLDLGHFFTYEDERMTPGRLNIAARACASCPVVRECAQHTAKDVYGYSAGVWKGQ